jgi:hypothetical protein
MTGEADADCRRGRDGLRSEQEGGGRRKRSVGL